MAAQGGQRKHYGVTGPLSEVMPSPHDLKLNDSLIDELRANDNFESPEATQRRVDVLAHLQKVTIELVRLVGRQKGLSQQLIQNAGGAVKTFGSYRLGVFGPGSDIDTLILAPKHVTREEFFQHFPTLLEQMSPPGSIEDLVPVPDSHVPIIKLEYAGVDIDIIFSRLVMSSIPQNIDLGDNELLKGLDETDLRCVNGTRVTDEILTLVPQTKTFRLALRAVKLWAQKRAMYGNVVGFPGGVAWAMLVARVCQLYPMAAASTVVSKFFFVMKSWPWPKPVLLKPMEYDGPLNLRTWNPQIYPGDSRHLFPIITPSYPSMCATHNVTTSTKIIIMREITRAHDVAAQIMDGKRPWKDLFEKHTFFTKGYKYYLSIVSASRNKDSQSKWSGLVQSKVRRLVTGIEMTPDAQVEIAHPFNKGFERVHQCKTEQEVDQVLQGDLKFQVEKTETTDETKNIVQAAAAEDGEGKGEVPTANGDAPKVDEDADGTSTIYTTTYYVGIELQPGAKKLDISMPVAEFKRICTEWPEYDQNMNSIRIVHTRNHDLPADVFGPGEIRPTKVKKTKSSKTGPSAPSSNGTPQSQKSTPLSQKRSFSESGLNNATDKENKRQTPAANGVPASGVKRSFADTEMPDDGNSEAKRRTQANGFVGSTPAD